MKLFVYLGNFIPAHSTENHIASTLESLGHRVIKVQEDITGSDRLLEILRDYKLDAFLFTKTWGGTLTGGILINLKKRGIPTISYHLDLYLGLMRDGDIKTDPFWKTDYVFTPDGDPKCAKEFKRLGINHYYLPPAVYEPECYILDNAKVRDVIFVGSYPYLHPEWPYRNKLIEWLRQFRNFQLWGNTGRNKVRGKELNSLYSSTKVVVGDSLCLDFKHKNYWSDRVPETLGRGGFLIHPYIVGLDKQYEDKKHLVFYEYNNFDQLKELIEYYLKHPAEREAIRLQGNEHVKKNHTYTNRMKTMLEVVYGG